MILDVLEIPIKSEVCITPNACYPVNTTIPGWITLILIGSMFLLVQNFVKK